MTKFLDLIRAIENDDVARATALLVGDPALARASEPVGATRTGAKGYFFDGIGHYLYKGDTALHMAAAGYRLKIVKKLLDLGADPRAKNRRGAEPLHYAADGAPTHKHWNRKAQAEVVSALVRAGADPNAFDKDGVAPLHRAVRTRCAAAVDALITAGADPALRSGRGSTPMDLAVRTTGRGGSGSAEAKRLQAEIVVRLERATARP